MTAFLLSIVGGMVGAALLGLVLAMLFDRRLRLRDWPSFALYLITGGRKF